MKRFLLLFVASVAFLHGATVDVKFDYDYTNTRVCSGIVTTNCIDHFEVGVLVGAAFNTRLSVANPTAATGKVTGISGSLVMNDVFGSTTLAVIAVAKDNAGNRVTSDPMKATAVVVLVPSAPTNFQLVIQ